MKFLFIVQGEGRGHMTQAISLGQILREGGHEVSEVVVGKSKQRELPGFFLEKMKATITPLDSPNFVTDKQHKSVKPMRTVIYTLLNSPKYKKSLKKIHEIVQRNNPDVIVNFYDFLGGLYNFSYSPRAKFVCLAHQYLVIHPDFDFPPGRKIERTTLKLANKITALGADKILALSFQPFQDLPRKKTFVVPPLLRSEVKALQPSSGESVLIYIVNPGYGQEVETFHKEYPEVTLDCFWDKKDKPVEWKVDETLTFHQLNDQKFIEKMAQSKGYITTAGFESVCEAMYLGKPTMMIPVKGHFEQACNAVDGEKAGAGIQNDEFNIKKLVDFIPDYKDISPVFRPWADQNTAIFLKHLS